jgi:hypothetical protein
LMAQIEIEPAPRHLRIALLLGAAGSVSVLLLLPYVLSLAPPAVVHALPPLPIFAAVQFLQAFVLFALAAWAGLRLGYAYGLDAPLLRRAWEKSTQGTIVTNWSAALGLGAAVGVICILLVPLLPIPSVAMNQPVWWKGLLASFYGGIGEEVLCRLLLVSVFVWIGARLTRPRPPGTAVYIAAIVLAAVLFGAGHLPQLVLLTGSLNLAAASSVVALNALCGIAFGWLFWRYGLEHAMVAHFSADLVLHVAASLL